MNTHASKVLLDTPIETSLVLGNRAMRAGDCGAAIDYYLKALEERPELSRMIEGNLVLARKNSSFGSIVVKEKCKFYDFNLLANIKLHPIQDLEIDSTDVNYWLSLGKDPHFYHEMDEVNQLSIGWYRLDLLISSSRKNNVAKLYFDYGQGYEEVNSFILPYKTDHHATRIIYISHKIQRIRFDPKECEGRFKILGYHLTQIDKLEAFDLMLRQMLRSEKYRDLTPEKLKQNLLIQADSHSALLADKILAPYNEIFVIDTYNQINYREWIEQVEQPALPTPQQINDTLASLSYKPLISIVMPVYNTDGHHLCACIDSVLAQNYPYWELCIADDVSPKQHVKRVLDSYAALDDRIRVVYRTENGHISKATNSALELATGDYVALMDHDDALPEHALYFVALSINEHPQAQVFYSDEDKLELSGERVTPHFKSDWNPDLFFSQNYVSHLGVYRRSLLKKINGFRTGVEGSQDQDLLLRCLPHVTHDQIIHIPRVLYHWRMVEGSTALASSEKSYTTDAGIRALRDYFDTQNPKVQVEQGMVTNTYRIRWPLPAKPPLVSLLIPTRDCRSLTETCVRSILDKSTYTNFEILILDNGSVEADTLAFFEQIQCQDKRVSVLRYDHPFNYSAINNFGVAQARGDIIGLVNNDIEVISPEWLTEMVSQALRPEIGCVGAKLYYSNDTIQHAGVICSIGGVAGHSHKHFSRKSPGYFSRLLLAQTLSAVTAACLLIRKEVYNQVGGLDEKNLKVAFNDVDFCLKVRAAGYRNLWTPYAELYHYESISRGAEDTPEKIKRFGREVNFMQQKWGAALESDPYYNPNLTRDREDFSITTR